MANIEHDITNSLFTERENGDKHPTYDAEMAFYNMIADGKTDEMLKIWNSKAVPRSDATVRGVLSTNPLRNSIYHFVAMVSVVTRVCIIHGLGQDVAYKTSDAFINRVDKLTRPEDVHKLQTEMIIYFSNLMASQAKSKPHSKQIVLCIDYINQNLHNNITVSELAEHVSLNETYLSKLFKKEMGCTVSEFIRDKKIEEACWLLRFTDKSSIEIATDLSFSSHSYFISVFKKVMTITPKEYRNRQFRSL